MSQITALVYFMTRYSFTGPTPLLSPAVLRFAVVPRREGMRGDLAAASTDNPTYRGPAVIPAGARRRTVFAHVWHNHSQPLKCSAAKAVVRLVKLGVNPPSLLAMHRCIMDYGHIGPPRDLDRLHNIEPKWQLIRHWVKVAPHTLIAAVPVG